MNTMNPIAQIAAIISIIFVAFFAQELSHSNTIQTILPEWPFLFCMYFSVSPRFYFGVVSACLVGVIQDVFLGAPLIGIHAAIYTVCACILMINRMRFRHFSLIQQSLFISMLVLLKIILFTTYQSLYFSTPRHFWALLSVPMSGILWPLVYVVFQVLMPKRRGQ